MSQRKDNYRAALQRRQLDPQLHTPAVTTLNSRYVRITVELDPKLQRYLDRWTAKAALLTKTGTTVVRLLTALAASTPPFRYGQPHPNDGRGPRRSNRHEE